MMSSFGRALVFPLAALPAVFFLFGGVDLVPLSAETTTQFDIRLLAPRGVFVDDKENILVASPGTNSVVLFKPRQLLRFEEDAAVSSFMPSDEIQGTTTGGRLSRPSDVAVDRAGRIVVADTGNDLVKIYEGILTPGRFSVDVIRASWGRKLFSSPEGVTVDEQGNIIVFDTGSGQVQILSPKGKPLAVLSARGDQQPPDLRASQQKPEPFLRAPIAGCCPGNGYLAVADRGLPTYSVWRYDPESPQSETCQFVGYGPPGEDAFNFYIRDMAYDSQRRRMAYLGSNYPLRNAAFLYIRELSPDRPGGLMGGEIPCSLRIPLLGWLENPAGVAFGPDGDLFITDAASDSVQKISRETFTILNAPVSVDAQRTRAVLKYFSTAEVPTELEYGSVPTSIGQVGPLKMSSSDPARVLAHTVQLSGLLPSTRYAYRYLLSRDMFCRVSRECLPNFSKTRLFATQSAARRMEYLNFPLTVLTTGLTNEQIERVRSQLESARLFFWVNSRMTCNVKPAVIPISEPPGTPLLPALTDLKRDTGELSRLGDFLRQLNEVVLKHAGADPLSSRNLFLIFLAAPHREGGRDPLPITCGLDQLGGAVSIFARRDDDTFSFIEEYQRHLSIMHLASGKSDTLSCLSEASDSDRSMVLWDSVADLARALGRQGWLSNRYGIFKMTADNDEDGVPDDEPDCPLDEKRFGTSPRRRDTDNDAVSDLNEILASRWATDFPIEGVRMIENHVRPSPSNPDTDGDGIADLADRNPLCPLDDLIRKLDVVIDGKIGKGEWERAAVMQIADSEFIGVLRVGWNGTHFCFFLTGTGRGVSQGPPSIRIRVDGAADGFLRGSDNLTLSLHPTKEGSFAVIRTIAGTASAPGSSPNRTSSYDPGQVLAAWSMTQDHLEVEIGLPGSAAVGLNLFAGEEIAFDFELHPAESSIWLRVFEPLALFRGWLIQPQEEAEMPD